jgi:hypothetical protein
MPFDPAVSEVVETRPVDDPDHHHVVMKELMRGYRLNGRVARPVRVAIGEYHGTPPPAEPDETPLASLTETPLLEAEPEPFADPPAPHDDEAAGEAEPSLEEIVARAEAQEALFPDAFEEPAKKEDER